jgi:hypothetical protein
MGRVARAPYASNKASNDFESLPPHPTHVPVEVLYYTSRSAILEAFVDCGQYAPVEPLTQSALRTALRRMRLIWNLKLINWL